MGSPAAGPGGTQLVGHLGDAHPVVTDPDDAASECRTIGEHETDDLADRYPADKSSEPQLGIGLVEEFPRLLFVFPALRGHELSRDRIEIVHP